MTDQTVRDELAAALSAANDGDQAGERSHLEAAIAAFDAASTPTPSTSSTPPTQPAGDTPAPTTEPSHVDNTVPAADNTAASSSTQDAGGPVTPTGDSGGTPPAGGPTAPATPPADGGAPAPVDQGDHSTTDAIALLEQAIAILSA